MPLPATDSEREQALETAYTDLGYYKTNKTYDQSKLKAYNLKIKQKLQQKVNFELKDGDEGGEDNANPPGIKEYPLWKVMKKIERDAPEDTEEQRKKKIIAIGSIRALIYLRVNREYAAELAFLYDVDKSIFHKFKLDNWNKAINYDLNKHGGWRSQEYPPFKNIGMNPRLTNHLDFYVRSFNDKTTTTPPWTKEEIQKRLDTDLANIEIMVSAMINQEYSEQKQAKFLTLFLNNIKPDGTGCASERLQGAIEAIGTEMQGNHSFNELLHHSEACKKLITLIQSKDKHDLSKMAEVHLDLFVELQGQTIVFANGTEINVSPEKYMDIVNKIKAEFIESNVFTASSAPAFYKDPAASFINAIELPEFSGVGNIGKLKFKTMLEAEKAFLYSQNLIGKDCPEFAQKSKVIQSSPGNGFEFSISQEQYIMLTSLKDAAKPKLEKTAEEQIKDIIIAKLQQIRDQLQLTEGEYYNNIAFADKQIEVSNSGSFSLIDQYGNSIEESGLIQNEEEEINTFSELQKMQSFLEVVEQNIEAVKLSIDAKRKLKEEQTKKINLIKKIQALYGIINDKAEMLDPEQNKFFNDYELKNIEIALSGGKNISVAGKLNNFIVTYNEHSIKIKNGDPTEIEEKEFQFWLEFFKEIDEKSLSDFDPTKQLQAKLAQGTDYTETLLPVIPKEKLLTIFLNMATPDEVCGGRQIPLNKIPEDQAVLLQNDKGELYVLNKNYVEGAIKSDVKYNKVLKQLKSYQKQIEEFAVHFVKDQTNQYSYNGPRSVDDTSINEAIEFLCETLSSSAVPPTLDDNFVGLFNKHLDPTKGADKGEFQFLLSALIGRFASEKEKTIQIKHPQNQELLAPVTTADHQYIKSDNLVAIYLQCCAKAKISLEDFHEEQKLIAEDLTIYEEQDSSNYLSKYEHDFTELSNGDHLKRFIEGDLELSEIETQFLKRLGIESVVKAKPKPLDADNATTINIPEGIEKAFTKEQLEHEINKFLENIAEKYIEEMRIPRTLWGGDLEVGAISELLNLKIIVHKNGQIYPPIGQGKENTIHIIYSGVHYDVCDEQGNLTWHALGDNDCLFHSCIQAAILRKFPVAEEYTIDEKASNNDQKRLEIAEKLRNNVCNYLADEKNRLSIEAETMLDPANPNCYKLFPDNEQERLNFIERFVNNKTNHRIRQRFETLIRQTEEEAKEYGDYALDLPSGSNLVKIAKELRAKKRALDQFEKPKKSLKKSKKKPSKAATLLEPPKAATLKVDPPKAATLLDPIKNIGKAPSKKSLDSISKEFILNSIEIYFNLDETKKRLRDIQYIKSTSQAVDFIGHFESTKTKSILATIRQDSIECSLLSGKSMIIPEQQKILMEFLKFQSIQAKSKGNEQAVIVVAENFSPKELEGLLNSLNQDKTISKFIKLYLPEFKLCSYRNDIKYTQEEYDKLKVEIYKYNNKISADQTLSEEQLKKLDSTTIKKLASPPH